MLVIRILSCRKLFFSTPAVIFKASKISEIVVDLSRVESTGGHAKDHILDESRFKGLATDMNLVIHIGEYSSVRNKRVDIDAYDHNFINSVFSYFEFYKKIKS